MNFKEYPSYKDSGVEWLGKVPEHWIIGRLKNLVQIKNGSDYKHIEAEKSDGSYPVYGSGGVFTYASDFMYDKESILLGRKGTIDKPLYVTEPFWAVDTMFYTKIKKNAVGKFVYYQALGFPFGKYSSNTALPSMTQTDLLNLAITIPSVEEQSQIASFLDYETSKIDNLIAKQEKLINLLEEHRKSVISHAVTKGLDPNVQMKDSGVEWWGEVPEHWQYATLKRVLHILTDYTANGSFADLAKNVTYLDEGFSRLVRLTDLRENLLNKGIYVSKDAHTYLKKSELFGGEVLLANVGAYAGFACLMPSLNVKATLAPNMFLLRFKNNVDNDFMHFYLNSAFAQTQLKMQMTSTAQPKLNKDNVRSIILFIPHIDVQINIVEFIKSESLKIDKLIFKQKQLINRLKEYRASIISHAVTGKIDVRDLVA